jgi:hypothetical protein
LPGGLLHKPGPRRARLRAAPLPHSHNALLSATPSCCAPAGGPRRGPRPLTRLRSCVVVIRYRYPHCTNYSLPPTRQSPHDTTRKEELGMCYYCGALPEQRAARCISVTGVRLERGLPRDAESLACTHAHAWKCHSPDARVEKSVAKGRSHRGVCPRWLKTHGISGPLFPPPPEKLGSCFCFVFSPTCGPAFGRSADVRKPRAAHQPPRFRPAPPCPLPSPPRRIPPRAPRRPRSTFHRHRSWQFLQDPLFLWELKELAPVVVPIGMRYLTSLTSPAVHNQHPAPCRRKSLLHQRRQPGATLPLGRL